MPTITAAARSRLIALLEEGATNRAIAAELRLDKETPARYRRLLGIAPATRTPPPNKSSLTIEQKWATYTRPAAGRHIEWHGTYNTAGVPTFTHRGRPTSARVVAFQIRTGRAPVGYVKTECDHPGCVAPRCVDDRLGRENTARLLAELGGTR
jgi:hypothetical protein